MSDLTFSYKFNKGDKKEFTCKGFNVEGFDEFTKGIPEYQQYLLALAHIRVKAQAVVKAHLTKLADGKDSKLPKDHREWLLAVAMREPVKPKTKEEQLADMGFSAKDIVKMLKSVS